MDNSFIISLIIHVIFWLLGFWLLFKIPYCSRKDFKEKNFNLSIIIPARNEEKSLNILLDSIKKQDIEPLEVILVDDQSDDLTPVIGKQYNVKVITLKKVAKGWLGKPLACYTGAKAAKGDYFLFLDADTKLEDGGLRKIISCFKRHKGVITIQPYHKIKKFYENFALFFNIILMSSMNIFTPLQNKLKPIGAFGPSMLCSRQDYFSIGGHKSSKSKILEDLDMGKKFLEKNIPIFCFGGKGTISFRMYPDGLISLVNGFGKGFLIGAKSTSIPALVMVILWISGSFHPIKLLIQNTYSYDFISLLTGIIFYIAFMVQIIWMSRRIGNFSIITAVFYPIYLIFFVAIFFWSIISTIFRKNINWKSRKVKIN